MKKKDLDVIITARVTPATKTQLTTLARQVDRPVGNFIRQILESVAKDGAYPPSEGK